MDNLVLSENFSQDAWQLCLAHLEENLSENSLSLLNSLKFSGVEDGVICLKSVNAFGRDWILKHFSVAIREAIRKTLPDIFDFRIEISKEEVSHFEIPEVKLTQPKITPPKKTAPLLYKRYTFDEFVEGEGNKLALSIAKKVALSPGDSGANPLFICGASGLGKTHLLQAIAHRASESFKHLKILYCSATQLLIDYVAQFKGSSAEKARAEILFRNRYENVGLLLIDDVQLLAAKDGTQKCLTSLIERMRLSGKQVVLSSDRRPENLDTKRFQRKLLERFSESFIVEVSPPDYQTRLSLIEKKTKEFSFPPAEEKKIKSWLAMQSVSNFRELEGRLCRLHAESFLMNRTLNFTFVCYLFGNLPQNVTLESICEATCFAFQLTPSDLKSSSRVWKTALARKITFYLCRKYSNEPLQKIGEFFNRNHSTVLASFKSVQKELDANEQLLRQVQSICDVLQLRSNGETDV